MMFDYNKGGAISSHGLYEESDGSGFYAGVEEAGQIVWRSLTTRDEAKAERWVIQARCHGAGAHTKSCVYCEEGR